MFAEPGRLFSRAKITITDCRNHLESDIIAAWECFKSWYNIPSVDGGLSLIHFKQLKDFTDGVEAFGKDSITQGAKRWNCEAYIKLDCALLSFISSDYPFLVRWNHIVDFNIQ